MQSAFQTFLSLGFDHILDPNGYDHILFIIALCAIYKISEWKKVAILVTAFTLGHSLTLALSALDIVRVPADFIEFLIPLTILLTAIYNVIEKPKTTASKYLNFNYFIALFFGLIHGMGFSNFFRSTIMPGQERELVNQLFAFNVGVELGQLIIVAIILLVSFFAFNIIKIKQREWTLFVSGAAAGVAIILIMG
ncbi:HupE/UreJ family protein [Saprospiraceae bacterium]|jgi:hypothetical protein|nr:HupE/UreJ family protein [Bacteroidota bacterium]MDB4727150.1 HupE/UreJ family protein [Saprospiraceae bacterium]MDF1864427.1 HupE/UreJ family protein [Saprospiraceae bacterium]